MKGSGQPPGKDKVVVHIYIEVFLFTDDAQVFDLEENLREKDEVISARTKAVGLAAASLSAKVTDPF